MSAKFTPGPWNHSAYQVDADDGTIICNMSGWRSQNTSTANAALIAAAPELYAQVERDRDAAARKVQEANSIGINERLMTEARAQLAALDALLAKARGEA